MGQVECSPLYADFIKYEENMRQIDAVRELAERNKVLPR